MKNCVSIIIPCYNASKFVTDCLESLYKQTYKNIEIIAIDDGSIDNTLEILKHHAEKDARLKVISQQNQGVSRTRNRGIALATGEFIMFVDADDYIGETYVMDLVNFMLKDNYDLITTGLTLCDEDGNILKRVQYSNKSQELYFSSIFETVVNKLYFSYCYKTLYKRKFILDSKVLFNTKLKIGEDFLFLFSLLEKSSRTAFFPSADYFYRQNEESVTHLTNIESLLKYVDDNIFIFNYISNYSESNYLIPNRLLTKLNIVLKKIVARNSNFKDFKKDFMFIINSYDYLINNSNIDISNIDYLNKLDLLLLVCIKRKRIFLYYIICKFYFFIRRFL